MQILQVNLVASLHFVSITQLVECLTVNQDVASSSLAGYVLPKKSSHNLTAFSFYLIYYQK